MIANTKATSLKELIAQGIFLGDIHLGGIHVTDYSFKNNKFGNTGSLNIASASQNVEQKILVGDDLQEKIEEVKNIIETSNFSNDDDKVEAQDNIEIVQESLNKGDASKAERFFKKLPEFIRTAGAGVALIAQIQGIM